MKEYSVGYIGVVSYARSADDAFRIHASEKLSRRVGVYEWDLAIQDDGTRVISNPRRLSWPKPVSE